MMMPLVDFSERCFKPPLNAITRVSPIYGVACVIFREMAMVIQYAVVIASITFRRWCYLPSAIPRKYLQIPSWNIGKLNLLGKCASSIWNPFPKASYYFIGRDEGLRITHNISYHPANGLCLGMSLTFLAQYLLAKKGNKEAAILAAAKLFQWGGTETSLRIQALYDALMGLQGSVGKQEKKFFCHVIQGNNVFLQECQKKELLASIEFFLSVKNRSETLRQFVFNDLESKNVEITPDIYALTLELEAAWNLQGNIHHKQYDTIHYIIIEAIAKELQLEIVSKAFVQGKIALVEEQLMKLAFGQYLIQFSNHTIVLVKINDQLMALWDPNEGLALLAVDQQREALSQLLTYYGKDNSVALKVIAIEQKNANIEN